MGSIDQIPGSCTPIRVSALVVNPHDRFRGGHTIFLCLVIPGNQAVIILVLDSTGKPKVVRILSMCGTNIVWGRHQALAGRISGHAFHERGSSVGYLVRWT